MASKLNASYVSILQMFCDVFAIYFAFYFVFKIYNIDFDHTTLLIFLSIVSCFQLIGGITDFYRTWRGASLIDEIFFCIQNIFLSVLISIPIILIFQKLDILITAVYLISVIVIMVSLRVGLRLAYSLFFKIFGSSGDAIVLGDSMRALKLYHDLTQSSWTGTKTVGLFSWQKHVDHPNFSGNIDQAIKLIRNNSIQKVYVLINKENMAQVDEVIDILSDTTCSVVIVPELFSHDFLYTRVEDINGTPAIPIIDTRLDGLNTFLKRVEDVCVGSIILLMISPILLCIALAIKLTSSGPVFFKQKRYGLNGKEILVYKFRTMNVMENGAKVTQAVKNDPRLTPIGGFLRKTSLDELPQFINVIFGSMSVVGPRPHAVAHNEEYRGLIPCYMLRHKVKPGITGLAQIRGWRGETDTLDKMENRVYCDLEYIRTWSLWLDIKIIFITVFKGFINKAAY